VETLRHRGVVLPALFLSLLPHGARGQPGVRAAAQTSAETLEEVVVTASLRGSRLADLPASATILGAKTLALAGVQHFEDVLGLVPNLNWSAGTSRPRYFQLRGIGELEQYQGAPNASVGFLIDDIDFSGIGMPAILFDTAQVEVLRGPQGTAYGANALAGLVSVHTMNPSRDRVLRIEASAGDYDTRALGGVIGGPVGTGDAAWRLAAQRYRSSGFRRNVTLGRDDTNGYDESTFRAKLHVTPGHALAADFTALYVDLDNGFDAFSVDNSRVTHSDKPGRDAQRSAGAAARFVWSGNAGFELRSITAFADSRIRYSFDGDWGADPAYDFTSRFARSRRSLSQELRATSRAGTSGGARPDWIAGLYVLDARENNDQLDLFDGAVLRALTARYRATSSALFGEADWHPGSRETLSLGLRGEHRAARYRDTDGSAFAPGESMLGGHVAYERETAGGRRAYVTLARGYKAGGFNIGALVPENRRNFSAEYLWNLEAGLKGALAGGRGEFQVAVFHMRRQSQQVQTSFQVDPGDPLSFIYVTDNAARGVNDGVEGSLRWRADERWQLGGTLGLLDTRYVGYRFGDRNLDGRAQAHAPRYEYSLFAQYRHPGGFAARVDVQGVAAFFFDASHDQRSQPFRLVNFKAGYERLRWSAYLWVRNLFDADYAMRGFYFGNEPPDFPLRLYVQAGDPRQVGATVGYSFR
jgi:iron complex outermembrane receptor protein